MTHPSDGDARASRWPPRSLAVRLPNWLGDTVMAVPALRALREAFPAARVLAVGAWVSVLAGQGVADVLLPYPRSWRRRWHATAPARAFAPEIAVLFPNSLESAIGASCWGARRRVGFAAGGRARLLTDPLPMPSPRRHQIDEYLEVVEALGVSATDATPRLDAPPDGSDARRAARALLSDAGLETPSARPIVGLHLGAAYGSSKLWPPARVADFVERAQREAMTTVLLGPSGSVDLERQVRSLTPTPTLVGRDTPDVLAALLAEIDVLIAGDTGIAHLAAALGTAVVALFGPTDPTLTAPRGNVAVVRGAAACAPCFYRACPIEHPCMSSIDARDVLGRVDALLGIRTST